MSDIKSMDDLPDIPPENRFSFSADFADHLLVPFVTIWVTAPGGDVP
jgi:hypothetical protein